ncbi:hypothetical protein ACQ4PT_048488 [Festuca glaucescens]
MEGLLDKPLNPNKLLKEQFVSNLTGSSLLEIAALSTIVPAVVVLRKWNSEDTIRRDSVKKNDDALRSHKYWMYYFSLLAMDYLTVVLPILLIFTVLAEWAYICAFSLVIVISICTMFKRSQFHLKAPQHNLPSLRTDISSYRVSVILVTCLSILAVDFKIFPRRYAKAETYGSGIMDLGVGSFVVANALVSREARNITTMRWKASLRSISPLVFLGFARLISTSGVDYQVHVGEYGVHWNFFFTLAAISILTSIIRIHPKYCGVVGLLVLAGYQVWLSFGLNEYLISNERSADIISQNKEGVYSILGYWGMYLIGVSLGYYVFLDTSPKFKSRSTQVVKVWVLAASFWILTIILDGYVERVSRRMCNFAYVMLVFGQNFQVISILTLAGYTSYDKNLILEDAFNQNMLGSFLLANILTGVVNLSVDTLAASSLTAFIILSQIFRYLEELHKIVHCLARLFTTVFQKMVPYNFMIISAGYLQHYQNNNNITSHPVVQRVRRVNRVGEWWWLAVEQSRVWLRELSKGVVGGLEKREVCELGRHRARVPKSGATRRDEELSSGVASEQRRLRQPSAGKGRDGRPGSREEARRLAEKQGGGVLELRREEPTYRRFA